MFLALLRTACVHPASVTAEVLGIGIRALLLIGTAAVVLSKRVVNMRTSLFQCVAFHMHTICTLQDTCAAA